MSKERVTAFVNIEFSEMIRDKRKKVGIRQGDFAQTLGISRTQLSNIERFLGKWTFVNAIIAAKVLNIDLNLLKEHVPTNPSDKELQK